MNYVGNVCASPTLGSLAGSFAGAAQGQQPSQIDSCCSRIEGAGAELREVLSGLQVRLQNVLTPQMKGEVGGANQATPRPVMSPLADRLDAAEADLRNTVRLLRDIYDRLAV